MLVAEDRLGLSVAYERARRFSGTTKIELLVQPASQTLSENAGTRLRLFSEGALGKQIQAAQPRYRSLVPML